MVFLLAWLPLLRAGECIHLAVATTVAWHSLPLMTLKDPPGLRGQTGINEASEFSALCSMQRPIARLPPPHNVS